MVYSDEFKQTLSGALVAMDEAQHAATLLHRDLTHSIIHQANLNSAALRGATAIVVMCRIYPDELPQHVPVIDAAHPADGDKAACTPNVWHVPPLRSHQLAALAAQAKGEEQASRTRSVAAWHDRLQRFGAAQLNARLRAAGIESPASEEWIGWMSVKCLWESALRQQPLGQLSFDGHKGRSLYFGKLSHNLIQPLYVVDTSGRQIVFEWNPPESMEDTPCAQS